MAGRTKGALALSPLLLLLAPLRDAIESRMVLHMLMEFPWLVACGAAFAHRFVRRAAWLDRIDAHGLLGATAATCVLAFWMLPVAVDLALLSGPVNVAKALSLWASGVLLAHALPLWSGEMLAFFTGNVAWMAATAGLLFVEAESRLCLGYRMDEQVWTGWGLLAFAAVATALATHRAVVLAGRVSPGAPVP